VRFERLLRRRRDKLAKENPFLTKDVRARFDEDLEVVRRYTHSLNAEAQVALAVRDAFDCANNSYPEHHKIPTSLKDDGPLIALTRAALEYTPIKDKTPQTLCKSLERWPAHMGMIRSSRILMAHEQNSFGCFCIQGPSPIP